ncbi:Cytochrome c oxidase subunit 2 precursor [Caulifigura coniformis]|uniref:cytochrome-c oxidase n=1 Tax=Caulifigura coniformis TaxID=2527983 RepID=A0A517SGF7_9PLAN|nr:cytochrome c oxidase subunit II [Caulifigura coniformis]QDT55167.1 Cytochrome c oxidase subunit 2 precursor [Caulifigura coniformis]
MGSADFQFHPETASTYAARVDGVYWFLVAMTAFFSIAIAAAIVYLGVRYRKNAQVNRTPYSPPMWLELSWLIAPAPILLFIFFWSAQVFLEMQRPPADAMQINVVARQWMWKFQHPSGRREIDQLHVPVGRPVRLKMISEDVIHSFYVPAFRTKQDVLPGRFTTAWFEATKPGTYHLFCAEYCGTQHSKMVGSVVVMSPTEYEEWLAGRGSDVSPEVAGAALFEQHRCGSCHGPATAQMRGPTLEGIFGKMIPLVDGSSVPADDTYLRESIVRPGSKIVAGYQNLMPTFEGQLSEEELNDLLAYIKTLSGPVAAAAAKEDQP